MPNQLDNEARQYLLLRAYSTIYSPGTVDWLPPGVETAFGDQVEAERNCTTPFIRSEDHFPQLLHYRSFIDFKIRSQHANLPEWLKRFSVYSQLLRILETINKNKSKRIIFVDATMLKASSIQTQIFSNTHNDNIILMTDCYNQTHFSNLLKQKRMQTFIRNNILKKPSIHASNMFCFSDLVDWLLNYSQTSTQAILVSQDSHECSHANNIFNRTISMSYPEPSNNHKELSHLTLPPYYYETVSELLSKANETVNFTPYQREVAARSVAKSTFAVKLPASDYVELCMAVGHHFEPNETQDLQNEFWDKLASTLFTHYLKSKDSSKELLNQTLKLEEFKQISIDTHAKVSTIQIRHSAEEIKEGVQNHLLNPKENSDALFKEIEKLLEYYCEYVLNALPHSLQQTNYYIMSFCYKLFGFTSIKDTADKLWHNNQLNLDNALTLQEETLTLCADKTDHCDLQALLQLSARSQLDALIETLKQQIKDDTLNLAFFDLDETIFFNNDTNAASEEIWENFLEELDAIPILMTTRSKLYGEDEIFKRFFSGGNPLSQAFPKNYRVMLGTILYKGHAIRYIIRELKKHNPNLTLNICLTEDRDEEIEATKPRKGEPDQANIVGNQVITQIPTEQHSQTLDEFKQLGFVRKLLKKFNASQPALSEFNPGLFGALPEEMTACPGEGYKPGC